MQLFRPWNISGHECKFPSTSKLKLVLYTYPETVIASAVYLYCTEVLIDQPWSSHALLKLKFASASRVSTMLSKNEYSAENK